MPNSTKIRAVAIVLLIAGASCSAHSQEINAHCASVASATLQAGELRDAGVEINEAKKRLVGRFDDAHVEAGVNSAYSWEQLKRFPLYDFAQSYCRIMVPSAGQISEFSKLWLQTQFNRSAECSRQGHIEKVAFLKCWNRQFELVSCPVNS